MEVPHLERAIVEYSLPGHVLLRPPNFWHILRSTLTAIRLFLLLPWRPVESLFPTTGLPEGVEPHIEGAAISYALTEKLLRSPLFPFKRTCLRRCLLLSHLFRRSGVPVRVSFGVDPREEGWEGHSWLTLEGKPFLETDEDIAKFVSLFSLPRNGAIGGDADHSAYFARDRGRKE